LAVTIQNINGLPNTEDPDADEEALRSKQNLYFAIILYSTFGLSMVRFIGVSFGLADLLSVEKIAEDCLYFQCVYYWLRRNLFRCCRKN